MSIEKSTPADDDGVRYDRVDSLTVNMYVDGPGDSTPRPAHPSVLKAMERDREQIAELIARVKREQEIMDAGKQPPCS